MRASLLAAISVIVLSPSATADGMSLAGSLWQCTRAIDQSQFLITLYTGGGMGGGELESGEVSPYIFDASRTKPGEWPAKREQTDQRFTWAFPDQSMRVEGNLQRANQPAARLTGTETSPGGRTAVICTSLAKLPKIGEGFASHKTAASLTWMEKRASCRCLRAYPSSRRSPDQILNPGGLQSVDTGPDSHQIEKVVASDF